MASPRRTVAQDSALTGADAAALDALPDAAAALESLPEEPALPHRRLAARLPGGEVPRDASADGRRARRRGDERARPPHRARQPAQERPRRRSRSAWRAEGVESQPTPLSPMGLWLETRINAFSLRELPRGLLRAAGRGQPAAGHAGGRAAHAGGGRVRGRGRQDAAARRADEEPRRSARAGRGRRAASRSCASAPAAPACTTSAPRSSPPRALPRTEALAPLKDKADRVLVDAPCSGTGTYRRKPDARYRLTPEDLAKHVARQKALLERFSTLVKPGGRLIYGTCSVLREENEAVVEDFLSRHPDFTVRPVTEELGPELGPKVSQRPLPAAGARTRTGRMASSARSWSGQSSLWETAPHGEPWQCRKPSATASRCPAPTRTCSRWRRRFPRGPDVLDAVLPVWTPGSYLVREYARHLQDVTAAGPGGEPLPVAAHGQAHLPRARRRPGRHAALPRLRQRADRAHQPPGRHRTATSTAPPSSSTRRPRATCEHRVTVDALPRAGGRSARWSSGTAPSWRRTTTRWSTAPSRSGPTRRCPSSPRACRTRWSSGATRVPDPERADARTCSASARPRRGCSAGCR